MPVAQILYGGSPVALTGNTDITLLSSAARTATVASDDQQAYFARGVLVALVVSAVTDTPALTLKIQGKLPSGDYYTLLEASAAVTAAGTAIYLLHPQAGTAAGDITQVANFPIPLNWRVQVVAGDADSATYAVYATVLV